MTSGRSHFRYLAVEAAAKRRERAFDRPLGADGLPKKASEIFGCNTFSFDVMQTKLSPQDVTVLRRIVGTDQRLTPELAEKVAVAVKEWALSRGTTHYCHWFQPQTGSTAEKHDAFLSFDDQGNAIEHFTGKQLIQAEPDASSFPSGGMRATFEARGYTAWDASSPMFLMETANGMTLCIPSVFISYSGEALDEKTPLLRSINAVSKESVAALKLLGRDATHVIVNAGPEQEYFIVDETMYALRPDLVMAERALLGRVPPRHQQLDDHYFGSIKARALNFIMEAEYELFRLGVPCKTRHNEVAPGQYEAAPIFENANVAADHNQLVVKVIKTVAKRHGLVALFHEKPYPEINGSGKHLNWSLMDSHGSHLLNPGDAPHENVRFLYFLMAAIKAVQDNGHLLRMSVASPGNDFRLGANEAPPAIMSVFLGDALSNILNKLAGKGENLTKRVENINLDLAKIPIINRDNTDRNRTSPFAFTGNKFEFRAVGSSSSISTPLAMINAAMTQALAEMNQRLSKLTNGEVANDEQVLELVREVIHETEAVRFDGDNYSTEWHAEAEKRGLPNLKTTPEALQVLKNKKVQALLTGMGVYTQSEIEGRYNVQIERYRMLRLIELETLQELISNHVLPSAIRYQKTVADSISAVKAAGMSVPTSQLKSLEHVSGLASKLIEQNDVLGAFIAECESDHDDEAVAKNLAGRGMQLLTELRDISNELELLVDDHEWSLPKFREMLFMI